MKLHIKKSTQTNFLNPTLNTIRSLHFNVHKCIKVSNEKTITEDVNETLDNNEDKPGAAMSDAADKRMEADDVLSETATELNVLQNAILRKATLEKRFDVNEWTVHLLQVIDNVLGSECKSS